MVHAATHASSAFGRLAPKLTQLSWIHSNRVVIIIHYSSLERMLDDPSTCRSRFTVPFPQLQTAVPTPFQTQTPQDPRNSPGEKFSAGTEQRCRSVSARSHQGLCGWWGPKRLRREHKLNAMSPIKPDRELETLAKPRLPSQLGSCATKCWVHVDRARCGPWTAPPEPSSIKHMGERSIQGNNSGEPTRCLRLSFPRPEVRGGSCSIRGISRLDVGKYESIESSGLSYLTQRRVENERTLVLLPSIPSSSA